MAAGTKAAGMRVPATKEAAMDMEMLAQGIVATVILVTIIALVDLMAERE